MIDCYKAANAFNERAQSALALEELEGSALEMADVGAQRLVLVGLDIDRHELDDLAVQVALVAVESGATMMSPIWVLQSIYIQAFATGVLAAKLAEEEAGDADRG